jgi:TRAP-type C4-dicarboxylate transport system permease small subunit
MDLFMNQLSALCRRLSQAALVLASLALAGLGIVVVYGVFMRYVLNAQPAYVEQVALLLVICVAMFGASVGVYSAGHIGLDSVVKLLPPGGQRLCAWLGDLCVLCFSVVLCLGSLEMIDATRGNVIPTLGLPEACRYLLPFLAGLLVSLFSIERLLRAWFPQRAN